LKSCADWLMEKKCLVVRRESVWGARVLRAAGGQSLGVTVDANKRRGGLGWMICQ
jgi:hypothetical protein